MRLVIILTTLAIPQTYLTCDMQQRLTPAQELPSVQRKTFKRENLGKFCGFVAIREVSLQSLGVWLLWRGKAGNP